MYDGADHPSAEQAAEFQEDIYRAQVHFKWLTVDAQNKDLLAWHFTMKTHNMYHLGEDASYLNPRLLWTYKGEDFVGCIAKISKSCTKAPVSQHVPRKVFEKYVRGIHARWLRQSMLDPAGR